VLCISRQGRLQRHKGWVHWIVHFYLQGGTDGLRVRLIYSKEFSFLDDSTCCRSANARRRASRTTSRRWNYSYGRATLRHSRVIPATQQSIRLQIQARQRASQLQGNTEEDDVQSNTKEDDYQDIDDTNTSPTALNAIFSRMTRSTN
jgi:hypothetical protein